MLKRGEDSEELTKGRFEKLLQTGRARCSDVVVVAAAMLVSVQRWQLSFQPLLAAMVYREAAAVVMGRLAGLFRRALLSSALYQVQCSAVPRHLHQRQRG